MTTLVPVAVSIADTSKPTIVLGPIYKAFGEKLWPLMDELNLTLAA